MKLLSTVSDLASNGKPDLGPVSSWVAVCVAAVALTLSIVSLVVALSIARDNRFFELNNRLLSREAQAGRRLMHRYHEEGRSWDWVYSERTDDFDQITYALGLYQSLGQYARFRAVKRRLVKKTWMRKVEGSWPRIESFIVWRRSKFESARFAWDDLVWLAKWSKAKPTIPLRARKDRQKAT